MPCAQTHCKIAHLRQSAHQILQQSRGFAMSHAKTHYKITHPLQSRLAKCCEMLRRPRGSLQRIIDLKILRRACQSGSVWSRTRFETRPRPAGAEAGLGVEPGLRRPCRCPAAPTASMVPRTLHSRHQEHRTPINNSCANMKALMIWDSGVGGRSSLDGCL